MSTCWCRPPWRTRSPLATPVGSRRGSSSREPTARPRPMPTASSSGAGSPSCPTSSPTPVGSPSPISSGSRISSRSSGKRTRSTPVSRRSSRRPSGRCASRPICTTSRCDSAPTWLRSSASPTRLRCGASTRRGARGERRELMMVVDRLRKLPLPVGTIPVAVGLGLAGLMQYGFLVVAARALGQARFAPLSVFWALLFVCGPGFFLPLEQETGRAIAARRVRGEGGRPVFMRAALLGGILAVVLIVATLVFASPIDQHVFKGDPALLAGLVGGFAAYLCEFLARGALAGNARFGAYGVLLGGEGALRVAFAAVLAVIGVKTAGPYGISLIVASFVAIALATIGRRGLLRPGPPAPWGEITHALGFLLIASVFTQLLLSVGAVAVQLLATPAQQTAAGRFQLSRIVAYVPIFLFQAVQSALLPELSTT